MSAPPLVDIGFVHTAQLLLGHLQPELVVLVGAILCKPCALPERTLDAAVATLTSRTAQHQQFSLILVPRSDAIGWDHPTGIDGSAAGRRVLCLHVLGELHYLRRRQSTLEQVTQAVSRSLGSTFHRYQHVFVAEANMDARTWITIYRQIVKIAPNAIVIGVSGGANGVGSEADGVLVEWVQWGADFDRRWTAAGFQAELQRNGDTWR